MIGRAIHSQHNHAEMKNQPNKSCGLVTNLAHHFDNDMGYDMGSPRRPHPAPGPAEAVDGRGKGCRTAGISAGCVGCAKGALWCGGESRFWAWRFQSAASAVQRSRSCRISASALFSSASCASSSCVTRSGAPCWCVAGCVGGSGGKILNNLTGSTCQRSAEARAQARSCRSRASL